MDQLYRLSVGVLYKDLEKTNAIEKETTTEAPLYIPDFLLMAFDESTRQGILIAACIILTLALVGNTAALLVTIKRQIRPLFQTCLISLACSDLLTCSFQMTSYISQLSNEFTSVWTLGEILCGFIPFVTTTALISNSLTLVGIALDRYMVVTRVVQGCWEPTPLFCTAAAILVWGFAAGIASPMITSYYKMEFFLLITNPDNRSQATGYYVAELCASDKASNKYYFAVLFGIIFLPIVFVFLWLNSVIAKEIWHRRHPIVIDSKSASNSSSIEDNSIDKKTTDTNAASCDSKQSANVEKCGNRQIATIYKHSGGDNGGSGGCGGGDCGSVVANGKRMKTSRETRQLRMFRVVVMLMVTFMVCRMPTWIYLLYKTFYVANLQVNWLLNYLFGLLSVMNCVLNPLLYTFLSESIRYLMIFSNGLKNFKLCGK